MSELDPNESHRIREPSEPTEPANNRIFDDIGRYATNTNPRELFRDVSEDDLKETLKDAEIWNAKYGWVSAEVVYDLGDNSQEDVPQQPISESKTNSHSGGPEPSPPVTDKPPQDPPSDIPGETTGQPPEPDYEQILAQEPTGVMHYDGQDWQPGPDPNDHDGVEGGSTDEAIVNPGKISVGRRSPEDPVMSPILFTTSEHNPVVAIANDATGINALIHVDSETQTIHDQILKTISDFPSLVNRPPDNEHMVRVVIVDDYEPSSELIEIMDSRNITWTHEYEQFPINVAMHSGTGIIFGSSEEQDKFISVPQTNEVVLSTELEEIMDDIGHSDPVGYCDLDGDGEWHSLDERIPQLNALPDSIVLSRDPEVKIGASYTGDNALIAVFNKSPETNNETPYSAIINLSEETSAEDAISNLCMNTPQIVTEDSVVIMVGQAATDEIVSTLYDFGILNITSFPTDSSTPNKTVAIEIEPGVDIKTRRADGEVGYSHSITDELFPPINAAAQVAEQDFREAIRELLNSHITEFIEVNGDEIPTSYHAEIGLIEHTEETEGASAVSIIALKFMSKVIGTDETYYAEAVIENDKMAIINLPLNLTSPDGVNIPVTLIKILSAVAGQAGCNEILIRALENNIAFHEAVTNPFYDLLLSLSPDQDRLEQLQDIFYSIYTQSARDLEFILDSETGDMRRWTPRAW